MSNRDKCREWISGHYNVRHPFNDILDWLSFSDEVGAGTDLSALEARVTADEIKMQAFYDEIHEQTGGEHTNAHDWCAHLHDLIDGKADINHTHPISDITGLQAALDSKSTFSGSWNDLTDKPSLFNGTWASLTGKPSSFPPSAHTHPISDVTNLQTELDAKIPKSPKAGAITSLPPTATLVSLNILGIGLALSAASAQSSLDAIHAKINAILSALRSRDIITA